MSKLIAIQALRGLAALSVAVLHAQADAGALAEASGLAFVPVARLPFAAGVDVFFVISGFVMVYASRPLFAAPGARTVFLSRRIARIVPLYWAVTAAYIAVAVLAPGAVNAPDIGREAILTSLLFIPRLAPDGLIHPIFSLGWTLNYEMAFYALFAVAVGFRRRLAVSELAGVLVALAAFGALAAPLPVPLAFWSGPIILEFAFGLAIGLLRAEGFSLPLAARLALALGSVILFALPMAAPDAVTVPWRPFVWGLPAALIVAAAALGPAREAADSLPARLAVAIGDASYALYLVHPFAIRGLSAIVRRLGLVPAIGGSIFVALALLTAVAVAVVVHRLFERPATRFARLLAPTGG